MSHRVAPTFAVRTLFGAIAVLAVMFSVYGYLHRNVWKPNREAESLRMCIESLARRRPQDLTPKQWESAVAWTLNLHSNSNIAFEADSQKIRELKERVAKKLEDDVDLQTVIWIWDQYRDACSGGAKYQRFRPEMTQEIAQGGSEWGLNVP